MPSSFVIAIDGYSSCGKSTVAKAIAKLLGFIYVDSGAMYRAATLYFLRKGISADGVEAMEKELPSINIELKNENGDTKVLLNSEDVSEEIRKMLVSDHVSKVSSHLPVRKKMVALQQQMGESQSIVMDGRDIGTVVFPNADLKIYMTADPRTRTQRRYDELQKKGINVSFDEVHENLLKRDMEDTTRNESPLVKAKDALVLDNTQLNQEEQLEWILDRYNSTVNKH